MGSWPASGAGIYSASPPAQSGHPGMWPWSVAPFSEAPLPHLSHGDRASLPPAAASGGNSDSPEDPAWPLGHSLPQHPGAVPVHCRFSHGHGCYFRLDRILPAGKGRPAKGTAPAEAQRRKCREMGGGQEAGAVGIGADGRAVVKLRPEERGPARAWSPSRGSQAGGGRAGSWPSRGGCCRLDAGRGRSRVFASSWATPVCCFLTLVRDTGQRQSPVQDAAKHPPVGAPFQGTVQTGKQDL